MAEKLLPAKLHHLFLLWQRWRNQKTHTQETPNLSSDAYSSNKIFFPLASTKWLTLPPPPKGLLSKKKKVAEKSSRTCEDLLHLFVFFYCLLSNIIRNHDFKSFFCFVEKNAFVQYLSLFKHKSDIYSSSFYVYFTIYTMFLSHWLCSWTAVWSYTNACKSQQF